MLHIVEHLDVAIAVPGLLNCYAVAISWHTFMFSADTTAPATTCGGCSVAARARRAPDD